jgi:hypothetical protein
MLFEHIQKTADYFFLLTPTVLPLLPVVLVCCPRTLKFYGQHNEKKWDAYEWMSNTSVSTDFLQSFQVLSKLVIEGICKKLGVLSIYNIPLSIEEPFRDLVLSRILDDRNDTFELFSSKFSGTKVRNRQIMLTNRLLRSTSAWSLVSWNKTSHTFLMTTFEYRLPTPLILVKANITLSFPSTLVLRRRRMCWNAFLSGTTRAMLDVDGRVRWFNRNWQSQN